MVTNEAQIKVQVEMSPALEELMALVATHLDKPDPKDAKECVDEIDAILHALELSANLTRNHIAPKQIGDGVYAVSLNEEIVKNFCEGLRHSYNSIMEILEVLSTLPTLSKDDLASFAKANGRTLG